MSGISAPQATASHRTVLAQSYAQDLAHKHAIDCRALLSIKWYQSLFPTRISSQRQAVQEFMMTKKGFRLATSVGGVLTGRDAGFIIIDDPLKPEEALSGTQRKSVNDWYDHTLYSRLNDERNGCIIVIMQRLHADGLAGHIQGQEPWKLIRLPAVAERDETHLIQTPYGPKHFTSRTGEPPHAAREPLEMLSQLRETQGEYNSAAFDRGLPRLNLSSPRPLNAC